MSGARTACIHEPYCLLDSLEAAVAAATRFSIEQPEPGDYYVIEVLENRAVTS